MRQRKSFSASENCGLHGAQHPFIKTVVSVRITVKKFLLSVLPRQMIHGKCEFKDNSLRLVICFCCEAFFISLTVKPLSLLYSLNDVYVSNELNPQLR